MGSNPFLRCDFTKRSIVRYQRLDVCPLGWLTIIGSVEIVNIFDQTHPVDSVLIKERGVTEVVGHHNGWVQRAEIEGCDRVGVIALLGFDNRSAFVLFLST